MQTNQKGRIKPQYDYGILSLHKDRYSIMAIMTIMCPLSFGSFLHATLGIEYFGFFKALVMSTKSKLDTVVARVRR